MSRLADRNRGRDSSLRKRAHTRPAARRVTPRAQERADTHWPTRNPGAALCNPAAECQETLRFDRLDPGFTPAPPRALATIKSIPRLETYYLKAS